MAEKAALLQDDELAPNPDERALAADCRRPLLSFKGRAECLQFVGNLSAKRCVRLTRSGGCVCVFVLFVVAAHCAELLAPSPGRHAALETQL